MTYLMRKTSFLGLRAASRYAKASTMNPANNATGTSAHKVQGKQNLYSPVIVSQHFICAPFRHCT